MSKVQFDPAATIVVVTANPYKADTKAYDTFEYFKQCATVADFRAATAGNDLVDPGYLRYSSRDGYITVTPNPYGDAMPPAKRGPNYTGPAKREAKVVVKQPKQRPALSKAAFIDIGATVKAGKAAKPKRRELGKEDFSLVTSMVKAVKAAPQTEQVL